MQEKDLLESLEQWQRWMDSCERHGAQMTSAMCYELGLVLECARREIMEQRTENSLLRAARRAQESARRY